MSRAVIFSEDGWIRPQHLGLEFMKRVTDPSLAQGRSVAPSAPASPRLTPRQREALRLASLHGAVRRVDLVARFGISGEARQDLVALVQAGLLSRAGSGRGSRYRRA